MEKKKIVHIVNTLCFGGIENIVISICNGLNKEKYNVFLIVLTHDNNLQIDNINKDVKLIILPFLERNITGINSIFFFQRGIPYLAKRIADINPDIIHTHASLHRLLFISLAIFRSKVICNDFHTIHISGYFYEPDNLYKYFQLFIEWLILKIRKPYIIAISSEVEKKCKKVLKGCYKNLFCIPNGIELERFYKNRDIKARKIWGLNEDDILLVYVARLSEEKGHLILLQAMKIVLDKVRNVTLCLVGDGPLMSFLKDYVVREAIERNIIFMGATDKVPEILSVCDIGVFPSKHEGFGIALLEMMAAGLPIICSDIPIFRSFFKKHDDGLFFNVNDHQILASQLIKISISKELQTELSEKSKAIAQMYSVKQTVLGYEKYYEICQ